MAVCRTTPPPRAMLDADRFARCFLYDTAPEMPEPDIATVFRPQGETAAAPTQQ
jgi:hypothetical protein